MLSGMFHCIYGLLTEPIIHSFLKFLPCQNPQLFILYLGLDLFDKDHPFFPYNVSFTVMSDYSYPRLTSNGTRQPRSFEKKK